MQFPLHVVVVVLIPTARLAGAIKLDAWSDKVRTMRQTKMWEKENNRVIIGTTTTSTYFIQPIIIMLLKACRTAGTPYTCIFLFLLFFLCQRRYIPCKDLVVVAHYVTLQERERGRWYIKVYFSMMMMMIYRQRYLCGRHTKKKVVIICLKAYIDKQTMIREWDARDNNNHWK